MQWHPSHFYVLIPCLLAISLLAHLSRHLSPKVRIWLLRSLMVVLFVCEGVKQVTALVTGYEALYLPFHYSTTYYVCMSLYIFGRGEAKHYGACVTYIGGFFMLFTILAAPGAVVGELTRTSLFSSFYHFYSLFYHLSILLVWMVLLCNHDYTARSSDPLRYTSFIAVWAAGAIPAAYLTGFNYAGILESFIAPLEALRLFAGNVCYLLVYATLAILLSCLLTHMHMVVTSHLRQEDEEKEEANI